jgi:hypothetical protein
MILTPTHPTHTLSLASIFLFSFSPCGAAESTLRPLSPAFDIQPPPSPTILSHLFPTSLSPSIHIPLHTYSIISHSTTPASASPPPYPRLGFFFGSYLCGYKHMYERAFLFSFHFPSCLKVLYFFLLNQFTFTHHSLSILYSSLFLRYPLQYTLTTVDIPGFASVYTCESEGNLKERQIKMKQILLRTPSFSDCSAQCGSRKGARSGTVPRTRKNSPTHWQFWLARAGSGPECPDFLILFFFNSI